MLINLRDLAHKYDLKIRGVLHIGGHHGQEYSAYHSLNIKNVILFEPLLSNFKEMELRLKDYNPLMFRIALGNENKNVEMFVEKANKGQSSSILKPKKHLKQYPHITFDTKETVQMLRLDDFLAMQKTIDISKYNLINIDTQGYELEVFKGAEKTLKHIDYIYAEVNRDELYENCVQVDQLDEYLSEFGFKRVETNWAGDSWGDSLYIKNQ